MIRQPLRRVRAAMLFRSQNGVPGCLYRISLGTSARMCAVARRFWQTPAKQISLRAEGAEGERACTAIRRVVPGDGTVYYHTT